jgi:glutathione S-transferase
MKLYFSTNSPYARKVRVLIKELGLESQVELIEVSTSDPDGPLLKVNPLGRIPVLDAGDDGMIHDSPVIGEYLLARAQGSHHEVALSDWRDRSLVATADGVLDSGYAVRMEKLRPEALQWQDWKDKQFGKINRTLDLLESRVETLPEQPSLGAIALICTLDWLGFRHPEGQWLHQRPRLRNWVDAFSKRPSFASTRPD